MKIDQLMLCLICEEVSPVATHCPICRSQDVTELAGHAETIVENEREQRRDDLLVEIMDMKNRVLAMDLGAEEIPLGVCV
jgi:hypothetical protein